MYTIDRLMKIKILGLFFVFLLGSVSAFAQMDKTNSKKLKKVTKLYRKKKYVDAGVLTREVINDYPINNNLWNLYNQVMYANYSSSKRLFNGYGISIESENDSISKGMKTTLDYIVKKSKYDYHNAIYYSNTCLPYNLRSSSLLRNMYVDARYFTTDSVSEESNDLLSLGEKEFKNKNFQRAIGYYQKAYKVDTSNYKALLYVGDSYFAMEYYGQAAIFFRRAMKKQPLLNEPVK